MAVIDYAEKFERELQQKYERELTSYSLELSNQGIKFIDAQTIKIPSVRVGGYKDHTRAPGFNSQNYSNSWEIMKLEHDRDVEFFVDPVDIDETNMVVSIANLQNTFETEQAIPEKDSYRYSKLYAEAVKLGCKIDTTVLTSANILAKFDELMESMDEDGVPSEGRELYVTPGINTMLKNAQGLQRSMDVNSNSGNVARNIYSLDDVIIKKVPSARFKTLYDFTDGCVADVNAKQMNLALVHPSAVVCRDKYAYIKVFTPGTDSRTGDGYIYQNRNYGDLFIIKNKKAGVAINVQA